MTSASPIHVRNHLTDLFYQVLTQGSLNTLNVKIPIKLHFDITFDRVLQYSFFWIIRAQIGHLHQTWVSVALLRHKDSQQLSKHEKRTKQHIQQSRFMTAFNSQISGTL